MSDARWKSYLAGPQWQRLVKGLEAEVLRQAIKKARIESTGHTTKATEPSKRVSK
jgi:hypothetical protein